jgi:ElaA protein
LTKTSSPSASGPTSTVAPRGDQIDWQWSRFHKLSAAELYAVVRLREAVFVVEQQCPYLDADGRDPLAWHLLGWYERDGRRELIAYARVFEPGVRYLEGSIGRIVTAPSVRGTGIGRALMAEGLRRTEMLMPGQRIKIAAQQRLVDFYVGFGFTVVSAPYDEDGIMHVDMIR